MNETFISYSRKDSEFVSQLTTHLKRVGIDPWLDKDDIPSAALWRQEILVGIQFCHNFIYIISPDSVESEYCDIELNHALALNKRIIPVVAKNCKTSDIRPAVRELNYIFFEDFNEGLFKLLSVLDSPLGFTFGDRLDAQIRIFDKSGERTFPLYRNQYRIGRNPQGKFSLCGLFTLGLGDEKVSRQHCTLLRRNNRWCVIDGTVVLSEHGNPVSYVTSSNGVRIERVGSKGEVTSRERLKHYTCRILIHADLIRLSEDTFFIYEEMTPGSTPDLAVDDRETYTGTGDESV